MIVNSACGRVSGWTGKPADARSGMMVNGVTSKEAQRRNFLGVDFVLPDSIKRSVFHELNPGTNRCPLDMEKDTMKRKTAVNTLIICSVFLVLYLFVGHGFVKFYSGGKKEILQTASHINDLCNASGSCPSMLEGWQGENGRLRKGQMLYIPAPAPESGNSEKSPKPQSFRLIYMMSFPTDDWFEAQGGVGKKVTSGWTGR